VTEQLVRGATAAMKEADANYLNILTDLFCPISKKRVKERGMGEADESKYVERLSHALEATGTLDRVALGASSTTRIFIDMMPRSHGIRKQTNGWPRTISSRVACAPNGSTASYNTSRILLCHSSRSSKSAADRA
jgi:hypothetical protein